jgi:hypothetical protein
MQQPSLGVGTMFAARSTTRRTGVCALPMMATLVISAPSQWNMSMIRCPAIPGNRYLSPPEKPTTSWGKTGPISANWSYSRTRRLTVTGTSSAMSPPEISSTSAAGMTPRSVSSSGSFQRWLNTGNFARCSGPAPTSLVMASSLIGGWVPRAIRKSSLAARAPTISQSRR